MKKTFLCMLLILVMVIGVMPINASAEGTGSGSPLAGDCGDFTDGVQVLQDMMNKNGMNAHPRLIMTQERFDELRTYIGTDSVTGALLDKLRHEAEELQEESVCQYEIPDGIRLLETSKTVQRRVATLAMAYNIFGDDRYAQRCYKELEAACNFVDWNPSHFLDTAEMSTGVAFGYDWLYHWMNDEQRAFIRENLIEKGLKQVMEDYEDKAPRNRTYKWYQDYPGDNWKLVCNGGMTIAALAIGDEADAKEIASAVLTYAYEQSYDFVRRAYSEKDGTYSEGLGYWDYATYYLGLYSSSLKSAAGTDYGLAAHEGLRKSFDFVRYMSSNTSKSFSFGDDDDSRDTGWAVLLWLADYYQSYDMAAARMRRLESESFNYLDLLWINEAKYTGRAEDGPTDWGEVGAANASFRNAWDESGIVAALHTGTNNYKYHGHYDLGSFYIESNGARFFTDLGNEDYELLNRQSSYRIRAEGHNTLVINPSAELDQKEGAECLISSFGEGNEAYAVTDLTDAYGPSGAQSVVRGLKMIKDKECVIIQDEISLNEPGEIYWFAHTRGEIAVAPDGRSAVVTVGSEKLWVELISNDGTFTVMNAEALPTSTVVPNQTDNSSYRKLVVHLTDKQDTTISVACIPLKQGETQPSWTPSVQPMSEWASAIPEKVADVITAPAADNTSFVYNGEVQKYNLATSEYYTISDAATQTNAGTYSVTVALKDKENTVWDDGTTDDKEYLFTIQPITPAVDVSATPASDIAGKTINVTVIATNPYNTSLSDIPPAELTYSINGVTQSFAGSFVIPEGTAEGTNIMIVATTAASGNYTAGEGTVTVTVTGCTHDNKTLRSDADYHWYECTVCEAETDRVNHADEDKDGKCDICGYMMSVNAGSEGSKTPDEATEPETAMTETTTDTEVESVTAVQQVNSKSPKTGDDFNPWIFAGIGVIGIIGCVGTFLWKKKKRI